MSVTAALDYAPQQPWLPASENLVQWGVDFHELLLQDRLRMAAFEIGVKEVVRPGMVVLDLGTGTGVLAQWALEAGAQRVYGVDLNSSILNIARKRLAAAGLGGRFVPVHGLSFDVTLPEPVDLIVSEILGNIVDNEDCARILGDARHRLLKPDGLMLPHRAESYVVPVSASLAHRRVAGGDVGGTPDAVGTADLLRTHRVGSPFDIYYDCILPLETYLAAPRVLRVFAFTPTEATSYHRSLIFPIRTDGLFTGFKGYFVAELSDTVALDISGDDIPGGTTFGQLEALLSSRCRGRAGTPR